MNPSFMCNFFYVCGTSKRVFEQTTDEIIWAYSSRDLDSTFEAAECWSPFSLKLPAQFVKQPSVHSRYNWPSVLGRYCSNVDGVKVIFSSERRSLTWQIGLHKT